MVIDKISKNKKSKYHVIHYEKTDFAMWRKGKHYTAVKPLYLPYKIAETFAGGRYTEVVLTQDMVLYRAGVSNIEFGQYFSVERPVSVMQTRIDKAILPKWKDGGESPIDTIFAIKIPKGTKVYVGNAGYQNHIYPGGTQQVAIPSPWDIKGVEIIGKTKIK